MTTRCHPVDVAADGVDLTVVSDHAERMGKIPSREGVGGEPLVNQCKGGNDPFIPKIQIVDPDLIGQQHALVNEGAGGEGWDVEHLAFFELQISNAVINLLANHEQLAFKRCLIPAIRPLANEYLANAWLDLLNGLAKACAVDRNVAPSEQMLPFRLDEFLDDGLAGRMMRRVLRQKDHADTIGTSRR